MPKRKSTAPGTPQRSKKAEAEAYAFNATSWWLVDLHAKPSEGATPLVARCMRHYGWSEVYARRVLQAYKEFLALKKIHVDYAADKLSPSRAIDRMWHMHVLDTKRYAQDMQLLCGGFVHHDIDGGVDKQARQRRLTFTLRSLQQKFPDYDAQIWGAPVYAAANNHELTDSETTGTTQSHASEISPDDALCQRHQDAPVDNHGNSIVIQVRSLTGRQIHFRIKRTTTFHRLLTAFADAMGASSDGFRLIWRGRQLELRQTPAMINMEGNEVVHASLRLSGC